MEKNSETPNKIVETYAEDVAKVIENDKSGLIKKIIHDEEKNEIEKMKLSPESKKNKLFMFMSSLFILVSLGTLFYLILTKEASVVPVEKQFTPLIFLDQSSFLEIKDFNKDKIAQTVLNKINDTKVKNGGVEGIYLSSDKNIIGLREFVLLLKGNFVVGTDAGNGTLFVNDNFLMGVVNNENKDFFILLKMRSIADIFNSLRAWEKKMFFDLHKFFGIDTNALNKYLLTKEWEDVIIENKNARVLHDIENKIVMMYIFADDNSVVITNTQDATREIILRLASSQVKK